MGEKGSRYITACFALLCFAFFVALFFPSKAVILLQQSLTFPSHFQASQGHRQKHFISGPSHHHKAGSEGSWMSGCIPWLRILLPTPSPSLLPQGRPGGRDTAQKR